MDYSELQERVAELLGLPNDDTTYTNKIKDWINESYHHISRIYSWPWLLKNDVVQTAAEISTGTVSVTNDSTSITFSSAPADSVANDWVIQIGDDNWYSIAAHNAGETGATLADPYLGTTDGTATYTLRKIYYPLPSDFSRMVSVRQTITDVKLQPLDLRFYDGRVPDPRTTANPTYYVIAGQDSNQQWRMILHPIAKDEINIELRFYQQVTSLSADTDEPLMPEAFRPIIVFDVLARYGYLFIDDTRIQQAAAIREAFLRDMKANQSPLPDNVIKKIPWDMAHWYSRYPYHLYPYRFPFNFPITER